MGGRVKLVVALPDLAGAMQDDPAVLVELLNMLALADAVGRGDLVEAMAMYLPQERAANGRLGGFLGALLGRVEGALL